MGCDIHITAEYKREDGKWIRNEKCIFDDKYNAPFSWRSYSLFGFLAGIRNMSECTPLSNPRGLPEDTTDSTREYWDGWECDAHNPSWLSLEDIMEFDYRQEFVDMRDINKPTISYAEHLGPLFFIELGRLSTLGNGKDIRIVFWFDN